MDLRMVYLHNSNRSSVFPLFEMPGTEYVTGILAKQRLTAEMSLESEVFAASSALASPAMARFERDQVAKSYNLEIL